MCIMGVIFFSINEIELSLLFLILEKNNNKMNFHSGAQKDMMDTITRSLQLSLSMLSQIIQS